MNYTFYLGDCGSGKDIAFLIKQSMTTRQGKVDYRRYPRAFMLDLSRDNGPVCYRMIEKVKNGLFISIKFETGLVYGVDYPHIIIFSNDYPNVKKMSLDRWRIFQIQRSETFDEKGLTLVDNIPVDITDKLTKQDNST